MFAIVAMITARVRCMMHDHRYQLSNRIQSPEQTVVPKHEDLERHETTKGLQTAAQRVVPQFQVGEVGQGPGRGHSRSHRRNRQRKVVRGKMAAVAVAVDDGGSILPQGIQATLERVG